VLEAAAAYLQAFPQHLRRPRVDADSLRHLAPLDTSVARGPDLDRTSGSAELDKRIIQRREAGGGATDAGACGAFAVTRPEGREPGAQVSWSRVEAKR
jgi:hypothetical protein